MTKVEPTTNISTKVKTSHDRDPSQSSRNDIIDVGEDGTANNFPGALRTNGIVSALTAWAFRQNPRNDMTRQSINHFTTEHSRQEPISQFTGAV
jgi:hypothetical protein